MHLAKAEALTQQRLTLAVYARAVRQPRRRLLGSGAPAGQRRRALWLACRRALVLGIVGGAAATGVGGLRHDEVTTRWLGVHAAADNGFPGLSVRAWPEHRGGNTAGGQ